MLRKRVEDVIHDIKTGNKDAILRTDQSLLQHVAYVLAVQGDKVSIANVHYLEKATLYKDAKIAIKRGVIQGAAAAGNRRLLLELAKQWPIPDFSKAVAEGLGAVGNIKLIDEEVIAAVAKNESLLRKKYLSFMDVIKELALNGYEQQTLIAIQQYRKLYPEDIYDFLSIILKKAAKGLHVDFVNNLLTNFTIDNKESKLPKLVEAIAKGILSKCLSANLDSKKKELLRFITTIQAPGLIEKIQHLINDKAYAEKERHIVELLKDVQCIMTIMSSMRTDFESAFSLTVTNAPYENVIIQPVKLRIEKRVENLSLRLNQLKCQLGKLKKVERVDFSFKLQKGWVAESSDDAIMLNSAEQCIVETNLAIQAILNTKIPKFLTKLPIFDPEKKINEPEVKVQSIQISLNEFIERMQTKIDKYNALRSELKSKYQTIFSANTHQFDKNMFVNQSVNNQPQVRKNFLPKKTKKVQLPLENLPPKKVVPPTASCSNLKGNCFRLFAVTATAAAAATIANVKYMYPGQN